MTPQDLIRHTGWRALTPANDTTITSAYVCDMLSLAMAHTCTGTVWVTVQSHINVVAVAALTGCACVIVPEDIAVSDETLAAARSKDVCIIVAGCTSYGVAVALHGLSVGEVPR